MNRHNRPSVRAPRAQAQPCADKHISKFVHRSVVYWSTVASTYVIFEKTTAFENEIISTPPGHVNIDNCLSEIDWIFESRSRLMHSDLISFFWPRCTIFFSHPILFSINKCIVEAKTFTDFSSFLPFYFLFKVLLLGWNVMWTWMRKRSSWITMW